MSPRKFRIRYLRLVRKVHRILRHRRLRHRQWWQPIRRALLDRRLWHPCRDTVAGGLAIGMFFSMMFMPGQTIAAALVAARARVNIPFAVGACFLTNPFTSPIIRPLQLQLGDWLRDVLANVGLRMPHLGEVDFPFGERLVQIDVSDFILGFLASGILLAFAAYPLVYLFSALLPQHLPIRPHRVRTCEPTRHQSSAN